MKFAVRLIVLLFAAALLCVGMWAQGNFVYTNDDQSPNTVSGFSVASDGTLTAVPGSPFLTGGQGSYGGYYASNRIGVAIVGNLLFASNSLSDDISVFTINPGTGVLTAVKGSPFPARFNTPGLNFFGISLAVTPDGKFLMAAGAGVFNISVFTIGANGALAAIPGSPFLTLGPPHGIKVSPDGKFLAAANFYQGMEMFSIAPDGSLTSLGGPREGSPAGVDIDCSSSWLYTGEAVFRGTVVDAYNIISNGKLDPLSGSPFKLAWPDNSNVVLLSNDDKTLFVSNQFSNTITAFRVAADGSLSPLAASPFRMNDPNWGPAGMATNQDGTLLYVAGLGFNSISVFNIANTGDLTEVKGSPFATTGWGLLSLTAFPPKTCVLKVGIAIKAVGRPPAPINPWSKGKIPVAILSTLTFNAVTDLDTKSLTFGHTGNEPSLAFCNAAGEDMNDDGLADLVCHFNTEQAGFKPGDTTATLKGKTYTGRMVQGSVEMRTVSK